MMTELDKKRLRSLRHQFERLGIGDFIEAKEAMCAYYTKEDEERVGGWRQGLWCKIKDVNGDKHKIPNLNAIQVFDGVNSELAVYGGTPGWTLKPSILLDNKTVACALQERSPGAIMSGIVDPDTKIRSLWCVGAGL